MTKYIGRRVSVGLGKESARGTAVSATYWLPWKELNHEEKVNVVVNESAQGTIMDGVGKEITKQWGEGGFGSLIGDKHFGLVLYSLLGSLSSAQAGGETLVYNHTFSLAESSQHQSLTLNIDEANGDKQYALACVSALKIAYERGKILDYSAEMMSLTGAGASLTPAAVSENVFRPQDFSVKFAADLASLGAASAVPIQSLSIEFNSHVEPDEVLGNVAPQDFLNKEFSITGEFTLIYDSTTQEAYVTAGTEKAMRINLTNSGVTIGNASNPALQINLAKVIFTEKSRTRGLNDIVTLKVSFKGVYSVSDSKFGTVVLTNLASSY